VPVSVRTEHQRGVFDNRVSGLYAELPVAIADPVERLNAVRAQMRRLKASGQAEAGEALVALGRFAPPGVVARGERLAFKVPQRLLQTVVTNVPGPRRPLYLAGRRLLEIFPMVPLGDSIRLGVAIVSYQGALNFGVTGDYGTTADIGVLCRGIEGGIAELLAAAAP
jgi:diacylglycerol O-acyltransferase